MKKALCMLMTAAMVFSGVSGGAAMVSAEEAGATQTASAYLDQDGATVDVTVDLSGGWSVEFARGAVYLYEAGSSTDESAAAMCITLDQEVYEGYLEEALAQEGSREEDGGVYYTGYEEEGRFIVSLDDKAYVLITAENQEEIEELVSRFTLVPEVFSEKPETEWSREGYFTDENENYLSVTWMELEGESGWYVGVMAGEDNFGGFLPDGSTLAGTLPDLDGNEFNVEVSEDGEEGLLLQMEGGETLHFVPWDIPDATIFVTINTEGVGNIEYAEGEEAPEIDEEYPYQSAQINLAEPAEHTFLAWTNEEGWSFTKWTKDGEDFSTEPQITLLLDESADYVAVFDYDGEGYEEDGQNPVMNFTGPYVCGRARAMVEAEGSEDARVTITWGGSAWDEAEWVMSGWFDPETLTMEYDNCVRTDRVYDASGAATSEATVFEGGTGRIAFSNEDLTFTWEDDQSEYEEPLVFEWSF